MVNITNSVLLKCRKCEAYGICVFADEVRKKRGLSRIRKGTPECLEAMSKVQMRYEIKSFAMEMEKKLALMDAKYGDSWKSMKLDELLERLSGEWSEFRESVLFDPSGHPQYDEQELLDIANVCMMLYIRASPRSSAEDDSDSAEVEEQSREGDYD